MLICLRRKSDITGTHWIEFNISGNLTRYAFWDVHSKYLDESTYGLFVDILESQNSSFEYYGPTLFKYQALSALPDMIRERMEQINRFGNLTELVAFYRSKPGILNLSAYLRNAYEFRKKDMESLPAISRRSPQN